ncbi:subtilisin-like protease [Podospora aff. communis PSN243]|uniref:Subtilisin-like protease n=1 Tax=Podospora aff. communis PSN243 TaxID=3040156 RepID=A0AAV9G8G4_9PEZI|nr:subtilisin-like protease [Podospora aff. communis PSN243]
MSPVVINGNIWHPDNPAQGPAIFATDPPAEDKTSYILLETAGPVSAERRAVLEQKGAIILERKGDCVYLCRYDPPSLAPLKDDLGNFVVDAHVYHPACVIGSDLKKGADELGEHFEVTLGLHPDVSGEAAYIDVAREVQSVAGIPDSDIIISEGRILAKVPTSKVAAIAKVDRVHAINKLNEATLHIDVACRIMKAHQPLGQTNEIFKGEGETVCVVDSGFDTGDMKKYHEAFGNRLVGLNAIGRKNPWNADDPTGHGTHVAGCAVGSGKHPKFGPLEAPASKATLYVQSTSREGGGLAVPSSGLVSWAALLNPPPAAGHENLKPYISTNSWGTSGLLSNYTSQVKDLDSYLFGNQDLTVLFSAGNEGTPDPSTGLLPGREKNANRILEGPLCEEAMAKNVITVGSCESQRPREKLSWNASHTNYETWGHFMGPVVSRNHPVIRDDDTANDPEGLAATSSRGPPPGTRRIKPDVVAPGTRILSAQSSHLKLPAGEVFREVDGMSHGPKWWFATGTSMATPLVAGCCAVIRGALRSTKGRNYAQPSAALIRAILINGAVRMKGQYKRFNIKDEFGPVEDAPNPHSGFGRVNLDNSLLHIVSRPGSGIGDFRDVKGTSAIPTHGKNPYDVTVKVPTSAAGKSLTLKVTLAWTDYPAETLQNDLNLIVQGPGGAGVRHGNMGDGTGLDRENNVEQVKWKGVQEGNYTIRVMPYDVQFGPQPFALAWRVYESDDL